MPAALTAATTVAARMSPKVRIVRAIDFEAQLQSFCGEVSLFFLGRLEMVPEQFLLFEMPVEFK